MELRRQCGRHGGTLKRLWILLVTLSIPHGPPRAAWAALSANDGRQRLYHGDREAATGTAPAYGLRPNRAAQILADLTAWAACSGIGEKAAVARRVGGGG